jgi:hypothetical protein
MRMLFHLLAISALCATSFANIYDLPSSLDTADPADDVVCDDGDEACELEKRGAESMIDFGSTTSGTAGSIGFQNWYCNSKDPKKTCGSTRDTLTHQICSQLCLCHPSSGKITCAPWEQCSGKEVSSEQDVLDPEVNILTTDIGAKYMQLLGVQVQDGQARRWSTRLRVKAYRKEVASKYYPEGRSEYRHLIDLG